MKRQEFLDRLWERLRDTPATEKVKLIEYYNELYCDKLDSGESEESIVAGFGTPAEAAEKYLSETYSGVMIDGEERFAGVEAETEQSRRYNKHARNEQTSQDENYDKPARDVRPVQGEECGNRNAKKSILKDKTFWTIYLAGFIITIPITIAVFGIGIGVFAALFGVFIGLAATVIAVCIAMVACIAAGLYGIVSSLVVMADSIPVGLAQLGTSFVAIAIGLAGVYLSIKLFKLIVRFFKRRKSHAKN